MKRETPETREIRQSPARRRKRNEKQEIQPRGKPLIVDHTYTIKVYRVNDLAYTCVRAKSAAGE